MTYYNVAKIVNTRGLNGQLKLISITDFATERYKKGQELAILKNGVFLRTVVISQHFKHKNFDIVTFENHQSINDVEQYKGCILAVEEQFLTPLEDDEFYYHEIIGLDVYVNGEVIGTIKEILELGSNDVWVVQRPNKKDVLIPYIDDVVVSVSVLHKRIDVAEIEGLID